MSGISRYNNPPSNSNFQAWSQLEQKKLTYYLVVFCLKSNPSNLHQLRIHLKKAKTIELTLQESSSNTHTIPPMTNLHQLLKKSGRARQQDVECKLLKRWNVGSKKWRKQQQLTSRKSRKKLARFISNHLEQLLSDLISLRDIEAISNEKAAEFANRLSDEVRISLQLEWATSGLHGLRKRLKHLLFTLEWWNESQINTLPNFTKSDLSALEKSIGQWHDQLKMLENAVISKNKYKKQLLDQITDQCIAHCHAELENVYKQLKTII